MSCEIRVFGSPGTGKTHKIIHEILPSCINKYGTAGIIILSFTKTAAVEIISRIGGKVQTFNAASQLELSMDEIAGKRLRAGTIHSLCFHALKSPKIATGKQCMDEFFAQYKYANVLVANNRLETISYLRNKLKTVENLENCAVKTLWNIWNEFKLKNNYKDFTDLIEECLEMPTAPGSPHAVIVDEAQDLTPLQIKLLRQWNQHQQVLYLVGDDDQELYNFIGTNANELIRQDLIDTTIITEVLQVSRRLPIEIHTYSKKYIEKITKREQKEFTHNGLHGEIVNIGVDISHEKCLKAIIEEAKERTVMIIAPCDYMLTGIINRMRAAGVPYSNKYKPEDNRWNPISPKIYAVITGLVDTKNRNDVFLWVRYLSKEYMSAEFVKKKIPKPNQLESEAFYRPFLEQILCEEKFIEFENLENDKRITWFMKHIEIKHKKKFEYVEKVLSGPYKDLKEVTIGTIHSSKGREAQVVILCPDKSPAMENSTKLDKSSIIRQMYVGMTRASEKLIFCIPSKPGHGVKFVVPKNKENKI